MSALPALVINERIELTAGLLNTVAGFSLTAGGVGPLIALSYGLSAASPFNALALGLIVAIWLMVGLAFHWAARRLLSRLSREHQPVHRDRRGSS